MSCDAGCCELPTGRYFSRSSKSFARRFRKGRLEKVQKVLLDNVRAAGVEGRTILDIGCGVGALHLTLLTEGATSAVGVDMSSGMLEQARSLASERVLQDRTTHIIGDVVALKEQVQPADITLMDKVVCCYEHLPDLLAVAVERTNSILALSHPRDIWYVRWQFRTQIYLSGLFNRSFRPWWHDWKRMEAMIEIGGMKLVKGEDAGEWRVLIYEKSG